MSEAAKSHSGATSRSHPFTVRRPQLTPQWSRQWVIPDNVLRPADVEAQLRVTTRYPVNRPRAQILPVKAADNSPVPELTLPPLSLANSKVVVTATGNTPSHKFVRANCIWEPFDQLTYHFDCTVDQTTRRTSTPIKVKRWHVQALDNSDNTGASNIYTRFRITEGSNFRSAFQGSADDEAHTWEFNATGTTYAAFGEKMKNTYTFVYTGHGAVMCRTCHRMFEGQSNARDPRRQAGAATGDYRTPAERSAGVSVPAVVGAGTPGVSFTDAVYGSWTVCPDPACNGSPRSTHCIGGWQAAGSPSFLDAGHIADDTTTPTTPRYLMFSVCCGGAFETSLYDAYVGRGTRYCVGFKKSTRCDWARDYAKSFFDTWVGTHRCDPDKIPDVFEGLQSTWETKLQPDLFGRARGLGSSIRNLARRIASLF